MQLIDNYFKSAFSVDNVIFGFGSGKLQVLLIKRGEEPYNDFWALPGALVHPDENLDDAPLRILRELASIDNVFLEQVHTFGRVDRHPQGRVITVAYYSLINKDEVSPRAASFANEVAWHNVFEIHSLAFDHLEILKSCVAQLQNSIKIKPIGFELLPESFSLSHLQTLYEAILNTELDKRNFRKKMLSMKLLVDDLLYQEGVPHRPAKLFRFDKERYETLKKEGFNFQI